MDVLEDVQDFIETYTQDYHRSQDIADEMTLYMALNGEHSDSVDKLLKSYSQEDLDNNQLKIDWMEARIAQLETAIKGFIHDSQR